LQYEICGWLDRQIRDFNREVASKPISKIEHRSNDFSSLINISDQYKRLKKLLKNYALYALRQQNDLDHGKQAKGGSS
jgi:hypothetical protein